MSSSDRVLRSQSATDATVAAAAAEAKGASETDAASEPDVTDVAAAGGVVDGAATADEEAQLLAEVAAAEANSSSRIETSTVTYLYRGTSTPNGDTVVHPHNFKLRAIH